MTSKTFVCSSFTCEKFRTTFIFINGKTCTFYKWCPTSVTQHVKAAQMHVFAGFNALVPPIGAARFNNAVIHALLSLSVSLPSWPSWALSWPLLWYSGYLPLWSGFIVVVTLPRTVTDMQLSKWDWIRTYIVWFFPVADADDHCSYDAP